MSLFNLEVKILKPNMVNILFQSPGNHNTAKGTYFWMALCLFIIADKTFTPNGWLAWIPIVNAYTMCKVAGKSGWWVLLLLIPFMNIIAYIVIWMAIAKACGQSSWLGILMIIPGVNYIIPGVLAFG